MTSCSPRPERGRGAATAAASGARARPVSGARARPVSDARARPVGGESGSVAVEWVAGVALLLLPVLLLVALLPGWASRHAAAGAAAREGARSAAMAGDSASAHRAAEAGVARVLAGRDVPMAGVTVDLRLPPAAASGVLPRHGHVEVIVTMRLPAVGIPLLGPVEPPEISARHVRALDPHRSR